MKICSPLQEIKQNTIIVHEIDDPIYFKPDIANDSQFVLEENDAENVNTIVSSPKKVADEFNSPSICSSESIIENSSSLSSDSCDTLLKEETWKDYKNDPTGPLQRNKNKINL